MFVSVYADVILGNPYRILSACPIGGPRGRARRTLPPRDPILLFSHTSSWKSAGIRGQRPPTGNPGSANVYTQK